MKDSPTTHIVKGGTHALFALENILVSVVFSTLVTNFVIKDQIVIGNTISETEE